MPIRNVPQPRLRLQQQRRCTARRRPDRWPLQQAAPAHLAVPAPGTRRSTTHLCQFSEPTAAAVGQKPRYDPMANRPFIAFNVSDYAQRSGWTWRRRRPKPPAVYSRELVPPRRRRQFHLGRLRGKLPGPRRGGPPVGGEGYMGGDPHRPGPQTRT